MTAPRETYFATDGSYGDAYDLVVIDTSDFTEADWEAINEAGDYDRSRIANSIRYRKDHQS